jgi:hypothetical protein
VGGQHHAPAALPPGMTRYPLYRRLGGPQGRSGHVQKISPPPGFDPRTIQPIASRYTFINKLKLNSKRLLLLQRMSLVRHSIQNSATQTGSFPSETHSEKAPTNQGPLKIADYPVTYISLFEWIHLGALPPSYLRTETDPVCVLCSTGTTKQWTKPICAVSFSWSHYGTIIGI